MSADVLEQSKVYRVFSYLALVEQVGFPKPKEEVVYVDETTYTYQVGDDCFVSISTPNHMHVGEGEEGFNRLVESMSVVDFINGDYERTFSKESIIIGARNLWLNK